MNAGLCVFETAHDSHTIWLVCSFWALVTFLESADGVGS